MTKEKAIEIVEEAFETWKSEFGEGDWEKEDEALNMAISALKQMPETTTNNDEPIYINYPIITCDDTISRADAQTEIMMSKSIVAFDRDLWIKTKDAVQILRELPSVQPSRKGHWIKVTNGRGGHECNLCHEYAPSYQDGDEYLTRYCPNCGADMRGDTDARSSN